MVKIVFLRTEQEFFDKYSSIIAEKVNERLPLIRETVEFLTRMKSQYKGHVSASISLYSRGDMNGYVSFDMYIEFTNEKLFFGLTNMGEGEMLLDIEGFPCWNQQDDDRMFAELEKREKEREKNQEAPRPSAPSQAPSISRLEP